MSTRLRSRHFVGTHFCSSYAQRMRMQEERNTPLNRPPQDPYTQGLVSNLLLSQISTQFHIGH